MKLSFDERERLKRQVDERVRFLRELNRDDRRTAARVLKDAGWPSKAIARHLKVHRATVDRWLKEARERAEA